MLGLVVLFSSGTLMMQAAPPLGQSPLLLRSRLRVFHCLFFLRILNASLKKSASSSGWWYVLPPQEPVRPRGAGACPLPAELAWNVREEKVERVVVQLLHDVPSVALDEEYLGLT